MDQAALYKQYDFTICNTDVATNSAGVQIRNTGLPGLLCPTDTFGPKNGARALHNYAACVGATNTAGATGSPACQCPNAPFQPFVRPNTGTNRVSGMFTRAWRSAAIRDCKDGTSNTIYFGEVRPQCSNHAAQGWATSNDGNGLTATIYPINFDSCNRTNPPTTGACGYFCNWVTELGFKSEHAGGAHFLMGDGTVRFFSQNIQMDLYANLGAKDDKNPVTPP